MDIHELHEISQVPERSIRYYESVGLLPPMASVEEGYGEHHLHVLSAIRYLRRKERLRLNAIKARIEAMSPEELATFTFKKPGDPDSEPELDSNEVEDAEWESEPDVAQLASVPPVMTLALPPGREAWLRVVLRPGLELLVRQDAPDDVQRLADEIQAKYAG